MRGKHGERGGTFRGGEKHATFPNFIFDCCFG
jgi:hypothetical protein